MSLGEHSGSFAHQNQQRLAEPNESRGAVSVGSGPTSERDPDAHHAFMRLAEASLAPSYRLAAHLLGDPSDAEDATQEALLLAWRSWPRLRDPERFAAWFERILVNACYERMRRRRRGPTIDLPEEIAGDRDQLAASIARDSVGRALLNLSPEQRIVVVLRYWRDLSIEEIAERVGIPSGTVRSRLHYALEALRVDIDRTPSRATEVPQ
jgi:RNA polymerase sigma-70 factor (ECF subfamily)